MKDQGKKQIKIITEHEKQLTKSNEFAEQINLPPEKVKTIFDNLVVKRMEEMEKLQESMNFENVIYHYKSKNLDLHFNEFIVPESLNNKLKLHRIKLDDAEKRHGI